MGEKLFELSPSYRTKACDVYPICRHLKGKRSSCKLFGTIKINGVEYPKAQVPNSVFKSMKLAKDFLRIYATCDGGISIVPAKNNKGSWFLVRKIFISVKHPFLGNQLVGLLKNLGFSPLQYSDQIRIVKKDDIQKFYKEIGFIKGAKISGDSKFLNGLEKNYVLNLAIDSYENPKKIINLMLIKRSSSRLIRD